MRAVVSFSLALAAIFGLVYAVQGPVGSAPPDYSPTPRIRAGLMASPVRMNLRGKNRSLAGLGSYIVNAQGACNDCHTNPPFLPGGDPYQNQPERINARHFLAGGVQFGPFTSANITPDASGKPAGLTRSEFVQTIRTGHTDEHPQFGPFLQVMPWPDFAEMRDEDLYAVYEYLRSIPHAEPGP
jgi:hypothetical protein